MESSDPATPDTSVDMNGTANRRKSGRARQKPVLLNKDPNIPQASNGSGGKRKRADTRMENVEEPSDADEESSHDESDPDEEELKEQRRKAARAKKTSTKPTAKKPKTGPTLTTNLAVRPAVNGAKKPAKPKQSRARPAKKAEDAGTGLYGLSCLRAHPYITNSSQPRYSLRVTLWTPLRLTGSHDGSIITRKLCATW